jgi:hypothetical protein
MSDRRIVERLREWPLSEKLALEAADRIEALEAALEKMATDSDAELTQLTHAVADNIRKIEALEAALREIAGSAAVAASVRDFARAALAEGQDK